MKSSGSAFPIVIGVILGITAIIFMVIGFSILALNEEQSGGPTDDRFGLTDTDISSRVITDSKTGVYYLIVEHDGIAITPLLSADGLPLMVDDLNHGDLQTALNAAIEVEQ